ncbi:MAG TPA: ATP-binding cassette domain-containing protein [Bdellovibrionota bacterium]|jgi:ABC-type multidrug transport system ATPase subunit|nr:ATP-binding cassette domain-containing protein [Bdellovibrionota bacterium]
MKTLSFHDFWAGRGSRRLVHADTAADGAELKPGLTLIVAPNGYGKSTLLQTLAGVLKPLSGQIRLGDEAFQTREQGLYVPEYLAFPKMVYPREWMEFVAGSLPPEAEWAKWVKALRLEKVMNSYLGRMSQGERRKVTWLAAHVATHPVVLMDEPLDGLDVLALEGAREMLQDWERRGRITVVVAHQTAELTPVAQAAYLIHDEKLVAVDRPKGKAPTEENLRAHVRKLYF